MHLYVYYRSPVAHWATTQAALQQFLRTVAAQTGVHGNLQRRPQVKADEVTWMEVYSPLPETQAAQVGALVAQLEQLWQTQGLAAQCSSPRHYESFVDV